MQARRILLTLSLVSSCLVLGGCLVAAVGAGAGTIAYMRGDLEAVESKDLNSVYEATKKAVGQLELKVEKDSKDAMSAVIVAHDAAGKDITIKLSAAAEASTKLSIRVGTFGSETKSRLIYDQIRKNLQ